MSNNTLDTATLAQLHGNYLASQKQSAQPVQQKKGNVLTNLLPAIGGGLGAVAGIPLDFLGGAGSIAGGAVGSSLGEALKEHLLGQNLSAKQIGIQGVEGGALSAFNPLKAITGASTLAKGLVTGGEAATQVADKAAMQGVDNSANSLADKLITQGQQARGRVAGTSAGKSGQLITTPQDTARFNAVLDRENIPIGNANNTLQNIQSKLDQYGKQIGDHFATNNSALNPADTKTLAANYLTGLKTTDPGVLKQANILANDLENNVKDTKSLWEFRKTLDDRIPTTKQGATLAVSNKIEAVKGLRQYIANQLGDIPGASQYHDLSEIKPLVAGEAQRLNNPSGGLLGRLAASGPAQKTEALIGKGTEALGTKLGGKSPASLEGALKQGAESSVLDNGVIANVRAAGNRVVDRGDMVDIVSKDGSRTTLPREEFNNLGKNSSLPVGTVPQVNSQSVLRPELEGVPKDALPPDAYQTVQKPVGTGSVLQAQVPGNLESALQSASNAAGEIGDNAIKELPVTSHAAQILNALKGTATLPLRATLAPLAYPGRSIGQVGKQAIGRSIGDLLTANGSQPQTPQSTDLAGALSQNDQPNQPPQVNQSPYSQEALQYDIQRDPANAEKYIQYFTNLDKIYNQTPASTVSKPSAQQQSLATSALDSIQKLSSMIQQNPGIVNKDAAPGQGLPIVGGLVSRAAGTSDYHTQAGNIAQAILHLQTGAAFSAQEKQAVQANLPRLGDSAEDIQNKLNTLAGFLTPFIGKS